MKFLKNNLKVIIAFILGATVAGGIVYAATSASEVTYSTSKNAEIKNVEQALNDLYAKSTTYKKLDTITTANASDILNGKTAYNNLGNLITGNYNNNITFTLLNEIGTEQFQLSETLINLYSKIKITSDNKLSGNTYTYGITNSDGSSEITFNRNQEYNIQDLYNSGYNKIYVRSDGWAYIKVEMYN